MKISFCLAYYNIKLKKGCCLQLKSIEIQKKSKNLCTRVITYNYLRTIVLTLILHFLYSLLHYYYIILFILYEKNIYKFTKKVPCQQVMNIILKI